MGLDYAYMYHSKLGSGLLEYSVYWCVKSLKDYGFSLALLGSHALELTSYISFC